MGNFTKKSLLTYVQRNKRLKKIRKNEYWSESSIKSKNKSMFGIPYKKNCDICSTIFVFNYLVCYDSTIANALEKLNIQIQYKAFARKVCRIYHTDTSTIINNIKGVKQMESKFNYLADSTDDAAIAERADLSRVLSALGKSSKDKPLTIQIIKKLTQNRNPRAIIIFLRQIGVPIISKPGRYRAGYFLATKGCEKSEECCCLGWINALRRSKWNKPAISTLFGRY